MAGGADVSFQCSDFKLSVAHIAAQERQVGILRAMMDHRADVNAADEEASTPLHCTAAHNEAEAVNVLIDAGANFEARTDGDGYTPLHFAPIEYSLEALTAVLKHGANANVQDGIICSKLHCIVQPPKLQHKGPMRL